MFLYLGFRQVSCMDSSELGSTRASRALEAEEWRHASPEHLSSHQGREPTA